MKRRKSHLLYDSVANGDIEDVSSFIRNGADIDSIINGYPIVNLAAQHIHSDLTTFLIKAGANINQVDQSRKTPLHHAAANGMVDVITLLVKSGADINVQSGESDCSPLHLAVDANEFDSVKCLIELGADIESRDNDDGTPLHWAAEGGRLEILNFLIELGADVNAKARFDMLPLHGAAGFGHEQCLHSLMEAGTKLNFEESSRTALYDIMHRPRSVFYLFYAGADFEVRDNPENLVLDWMLADGSFPTVKELIQCLLLLDSKQTKPPLLHYPFLDTFWDGCKSDVEKLQINQIGNSNVTFEHFLMQANVNILANYFCNKGFREYFTGRGYADTIPTFVDMIEYQVKRGKKRASCLNKSYQVMLHSNMAKLRDDAKRKVVEYLSTTDMEKITSRN